MIVIQAPRHRYYSVLGLLLHLGVEIANHEELELAVFSREPLHFVCSADKQEQIALGLEELKTEFGENFNIIGAD